MWSQSTLISTEVCLKNQINQEFNNEAFMFKELHRHLSGEEIQQLTT